MLASIGRARRPDWWYDRDWLDDTLDRGRTASTPPATGGADLYRAAMAEQRRRRTACIDDATERGRTRAQRQAPAHEAESQLELLTNEARPTVPVSDFYSYRYFASEGFLPGYTFPRLPLSAYIPGRRARADGQRRVSPAAPVPGDLGVRPAVLIYHEGSRYQITGSSCRSRRGDDGVHHRAIKLCPSAAICTDPARRGSTAASAAARALPGDAAALFRLQTVAHHAARPDQLRRGRTAPAGLRDPDRPTGSLRTATRPAGPHTRLVEQATATRSRTSPTARRPRSGGSTSAEPAQGHERRRLLARPSARPWGRETGRRRSPKTRSSSAR